MSWIERPPLFFRMLVPGGIFRVRDIPPGMPQSGGRRIYLTFDDGPVPEVTPWVLDLLDRYRIKATFFMVADNARRYPHLLEEVRRRGHRIGNHTFHHLQGAKVTTRSYLRDVAEADRVLHTDLFRPPHGWLRPRQARALARRYRIVMYDLVTRDYSSRLDAAAVARNVRRYARHGAIVVFHDSVKAWPRLSEALPQSIEWLLEQGYAFHTL
ncbi:MAG: polysaccharide deacetylase family protein [Muribaculaceae bacterium]|nr:polysaccharide deacetylase family protein [Muribaculaceae bacterium]